MCRTRAKRQEQRGREMEAKPTRGCTRERALGVRERHPDGESSADLRGRESLTAAWGLRPGRAPCPPPFRVAWLLSRPL